ncbi:hypothetical protein Cpha266_1447 [Chlorobium phaeobacteroides DSM 266]|uniref:Uncharacterized protein n=1 Tax=Chlorobium phaeobacteroides (strain DSM 266 / SMG 266 / 2430) TaxID=290317 RepID=A1BGE8_CHLPD|nr:hypothetical protein Cpha266_1447 [Chlorobium phaeobacteroides DSM 266]
MAEHVLRNAAQLLHNKETGSFYSPEGLRLCSVRGIFLAMCICMVQEKWFSPYGMKFLDISLVLKPMRSLSCPIICMQSLFCQCDGRQQGVAPAGSLSLGDVVHRFNTMTTRRYVDGVNKNGWLHMISMCCCWNLFAVKSIHRKPQKYL